MTDLPTMLSGELYKYTSVGCYPLFYLDKNNNMLCVDCAEDSRDSDFEDDRPICAVVNWEDSCLFCDQCGVQIESAYVKDCKPPRKKHTG